MLEGPNQPLARLEWPVAPPSHPDAASPELCACLQLEQERKRSNSLAESLKLAKEQSLAAVRGRAPRAGKGDALLVLLGIRGVHSILQPLEPRLTRTTPL
jgi:hypothetical protein